MNAPASPAVTTPVAQIAKATLRRLAATRLEPTPENYAQAWALECGETARTAPAWPPQARAVLDSLAARCADTAEARTALVQQLQAGAWDEAARALGSARDNATAQAQAWARTVERLARGLERGSRQWTLARKKDALQRVLDASRSDMQRLTHRVGQLVSAWDTDEAPAAASDSEASSTLADGPPGAVAEPGPDACADAVVGSSAAAAAPAEVMAAVTADAAADTAATADTVANAHAWSSAAAPLLRTVHSALPADAAEARALADELAALGQDLAAHGPQPATVQALARVCAQAERLLAHRHHLLGQVHGLAQALAGHLGEFAEDDSWVRGQLTALQGSLSGAPSARAVQAATQLLNTTRSRHASVRAEREQARHALKGLLHRMLGELGELGEHTGRFSGGMARYIDTIEAADSLESLAGVVREMVDEGRAVHALVNGARERLQGEHAKAEELQARVQTLEGELRRLSDEVSTDALTQVANRRGMVQAFERASAQSQRDASTLAVGLIDIDNFKRLNDTLGHAAGDTALVALAQQVQATLRPGDAIARFGGEEFVVLLPATSREEGQQVLTRLQRSLSASLFMHDGKDVFVTFSAGVTAWRSGEALDEALERADTALYEAKRSGKNRTCVA